MSDDVPTNTPWVAPRRRARIGSLAPSASLPDVRSMSLAPSRNSNNSKRASLPSALISSLSLSLPPRPPSPLEPNDTGSSTSSVAQLAYLCPSPIEAAPSRLQTNGSRPPSLPPKPDHLPSKPAANANGYGGYGFGAKPLPELPPSHLPPKPSKPETIEARPPALPPKSPDGPVKIERWTPGSTPAPVSKDTDLMPPPPVPSSSTGGSSSTRSRRSSIYDYNSSSTRATSLPKRLPIRHYLKRGRSDSDDEDLSEATPVDITRARTVTIEVKPRPDGPVSVLPTPLPSKRAKKKGASRALLLPVEQLPVFPLPPLPAIEDPELLKQVFTHSSLFEYSRGVFEEPKDRPARHYEKLEHVGDSILGMIVTTWLHELRPNLTCGTATKLKAHLVSNATLSHISGMYNFPQRLNGDPRLLPVLRAQTDVRAALVEAYIAALYFSYPEETRMSEGLACVTAWLREMYEPLYDFFFSYMKSSHNQHYSAMGTGPDGIVEAAPSPEELDKFDEQAEGMGLLLKMFATQRHRVVEYDSERFETSVGILWKITCLVDGVEMGDATRASKYKAKNAAAWEAAKKLGLTEGTI